MPNKGVDASLRPAKRVDHTIPVTGHNFVLRLLEAVVPVFWVNPFAPLFMSAPLDHSDSSHGLLGALASGVLSVLHKLLTSGVPVELPCRLPTYYIVLKGKEPQCMVLNMTQSQNGGEKYWGYPSRCTYMPSKAATYLPGR